MAREKSMAMKASIRLTREQVAEIVETFNTVLQDDMSLEGMTLFFDPDAVMVTAWGIRPDAHPFIAL
jgi:hypothetical protein